MSSKSVKQDHQELSSPITRKGLERRLAILHTAYDLFLENGFDDVSLDDIIRITGGSKTSIYQYFGDKEGLFREVCNHHLAQKTQNFMLEFKQGDDLKHYLQQTLLNFYQLIQRERDVQFFHLVLQQSRTNSDLVTNLNQCSHDLIHHIEHIIIDYHQQNRLICHQPHFAAAMFWGIIHDIHWKSLMNMTVPTQHEIEQYFTYSIDCFLTGLHYKG